MVDFALEAERTEDMRPLEAIYQACLLRFRPIVMTTTAALFGPLPLIMSTGMGAELRHPLGITIVGGLIFSQILTLYTTPVVYLYFDRLREWWESRRRTSDSSCTNHDGFAREQFSQQHSATLTLIARSRELASAQLNPEMINGHEALDLEKREPSVVIARFPDSACGDDLDFTWAAGRLA